MRIKLLLSLIIIVFSYLFLIRPVIAQTCNGSGSYNVTTHTCSYQFGDWNCIASNNNFNYSCIFYGASCAYWREFGSSCTSSSTGCNITQFGGGLSTAGCSVCTPNCAGKVCGEANGCGGSCPTTGFNNWSAWSCGACTNPGGCGNVTLTRTCTRTNDCGGTQSQVQGCGATCNECGPSISAWSAWSACTAPTFTRTRTRTCTENCGSDNCAGVALSETEPCRGSINGIFFDASEVSNCSAIATLPKISGAGVTATATVNHSTAYPTTTDGNGAYNITGLLVPDSYNLTYSVDPTQWIVSPPKLLCDGSLTGISLSTQGQAITRRVGLYKMYGGWFQGQNGDVTAKNGVTVDIPASCVEPGYQASCGSFTSGAVYTPLIRNSVNNTAGVSYSASVDLGTAPNAVISNTNYNTDSTYGGRNYDYGFYNIQTSRVTRQNWDGLSKPAGDADGEIFLSSGNITIGSDWNLGGAGTDERMFIVHDGNVTITSNLNVEPGSYLGIVASGDITFASNVGRAEGVFIANNLNIESTNNKATETQFVGEGTFIGWTGVVLVRDRGALNNSGPSELFIFRPDFVINAFDGVRAPEVKWQEVAP